MFTMRYILILLIAFIFVGCQDIRTAYWINIKNETEFRIGIVYQTESEKLVTKMLSTKKDADFSDYITIFHESFNEGNLNNYSQNEFESKLLSLNIFSINEIGDTIWYSYNDNVYLELDKWEYKYGWDDREDYHEYWLNITNTLLIGGD